MKSMFRLFPFAMIAIFLFVVNTANSQTNILPNGSLEIVAPNFWLPVNDGMGDAICVWDLTQGYESMRSFKIYKPSATAVEVGWKSANNADLYWNNAAASFYTLSFWVKTEGVNTSPANDDEKIGVLYQFYSGGVMIGEQFVEVDQSSASTDWTEYTGGFDITGLGEPDGVYVTAKMGKDATGTVWFDNVNCGTDPWSMGVFNADAETPVGWMNWASSTDVGFANTVQGETHSGSWSALLFEEDDLADEMVFYSEPVPAEPGKWYRISVWAKTADVNNDPAYLPTNAVTQFADDRLGLCFFFHKGLRESWDLTPPGDMFAYFDQTKDSTDWKHYSIVVRAPEEEVEGFSVRARYNPFSTGYCWYDDFSIEQIDPLDENILPNGGLENAVPNFWFTVNDGKAGAVCFWDMTQGYESMRSFKIYKPNATGAEVGWQTTNNADLYWNNAAASFYTLSFWVKTEGVNTGPANDDEKIGVLYQFYSGGAMIGEQFVEVDQSSASADWTEYTGGFDITGLGEPDGVYVTAKMGKNATGTVWFDNVNCGTDPWSMGVFNADAETPVGWMNWASSTEIGFANTVQGEAHNGAWSALLYEEDDLADEMVFYSEPVPVIPNRWYLISVWAKTAGVNSDPKFLPSNIVTERIDDRLGLCFFFHKGLRTSWDLTPPGDMFLYFDQTNDSTGWTHYVTAVKAPAEEVEGFSIRARYNPFSMGYCWYDDFAILPFDDPKEDKTGIEELTNEEGQVPVDYAVVKNYPNPFNPETTIEFNLPEDDDITLTIYNILGQQVRTLVNEFRSAGIYKVIWNGLDDNGKAVPSGIYLTLFQGKDFKQTNKMMLLR